MAKVDATRHYGAEVELDRARVRGRARGGGGVRRGDRRDVRPPVRGSARSSPGRARSGSSSPSRSTDSRRSSSRSAAAGSRRASRSRCARAARACASSACRRPGRCRAGRLHDRRRHRGEEAGRADDVILDECSTTSSPSTDEQIAQSMVLLLERTKLVVEGAGAVASRRSSTARSAARDRSFRCSPAATSTRRSSSGHAPRPRARGRFLVLRTRVPDRPGELAKLLDAARAERVNVVEVEHQREAAGLPVGETGVELTLLTRDPAHCEQIVAQIGEWGYPVEPALDRAGRGRLAPSRSRPGPLRGNPASAARRSHLLRRVRLAPLPPARRPSGSSRAARSNAGSTWVPRRRRPAIAEAESISCLPRPANAPPAATTTTAAESSTRSWSARRTAPGGTRSGCQARP